jgi:hypothetical protein
MGVSLMSSFNRDVIRPDLKNLNKPHIPIYGKGDIFRFLIPYPPPAKKIHSVTNLPGYEYPPKK